MYVVMNELFIPAEHKEHMIKRFANSAENMKRVPGCIEFMFLNHEKEDGKQIVLTKWESKEHFLAWVESDAFKNAHQQNVPQMENHKATQMKLMRMKSFIIHKKYVKMKQGLTFILGRMRKERMVFE